MASHPSAASSPPPAAIAAARAAFHAREDALPSSEGAAVASCRGSPFRVLPDAFLAYLFSSHLTERFRLRRGLNFVVPALVVIRAYVIDARSFRCYVPSLAAASPLGEAMRAAYAKHAPDDALLVAAGAIAARGIVDREERFAALAEELSASGKVAPSRLAPQRPVQPLRESSSSEGLVTQAQGDGSDWEGSAWGQDDRSSSDSFAPSSEDSSFAATEEAAQAPPPPPPASSRSFWGRTRPAPAPKPQQLQKVEEEGAGGWDDSSSTSTDTLWFLGEDRDEGGQVSEGKATAALEERPSRVSSSEQRRRGREARGGSNDGARLA